MKIAVPKETKEFEKRVALTPDAVKALVKSGFECFIEKEAGLNSYFDDQSYIAAGAKVVADKKSVFAEADVVLKINPPSAEEISWMKREAVLISFMFAATNPELVDACCRQGISSFSVDAIPRISRAQSARLTRGSATTRSRLAPSRSQPTAPVACAG